MTMKNKTISILTNTARTVMLNLGKVSPGAPVRTRTRDIDNLLTVIYKTTDKTEYQLVLAFDSVDEEIMVTVCSEDGDVLFGFDLVPKETTESVLQKMWAAAILSRQENLVEFLEMEED